MKFLELFAPKSSNIRWLRSKGKAYYDDNDNCIRFAGITQDISNELNDKEEQRKLLTLIDNTSDFISLSDLDGNVTYVNTIGPQNDRA